MNKEEHESRLDQVNNITGLEAKPKINDKEKKKTWNIFFKELIEMLPEASSDFVQELRDRLKQKSLENNQKKQTIENLREKTESERLKRDRDSELFEIDKRRAELEMDILSEELATKRQERLLKLLEEMEKRGMKPSRAIGEDGDEYIVLESIVPKLVDET